MANSLTPEQCDEIRNRYANTRCTYVGLAAEYGVSPNTISFVVHRVGKYAPNAGAPGSRTRMDVLGLSFADLQKVLQFAIDPQYSSDTFPVIAQPSDFTWEGRTPEDCEHLAALANAYLIHKYGKTLLHAPTSRQQRFDLESKYRPLADPLPRNTAIAYFIDRRNTSPQIFAALFGVSQNTIVRWCEAGRLCLTAAEPS